MMRFSGQLPPCSGGAARSVPELAGGGAVAFAIAKLRLRPEPGDFPDLGEKLGHRELGNPRDRGKPCAQRRTEVTDLQGDLIEPLGQLSKSRHPLPGNPSTNPIVAGQQPAAQIRSVVSRPIRC